LLLAANSIACSTLSLLVGCSSVDSDSTGAADDAVQVELMLDPSPPVVGDAEVTLTFRGPDNAPVQVQGLQVEGNMNHAGMKPSFAQLQEVEPGQHAGSLRFTMGGDWYLLVTATTAEGAKIQHKIDVPGVTSP
jgi:hypothetical protein